jgi:hypothetical protein
MLGQKRVQPPHRLARDAERLPARRQNTKVRTGTEQRHAELGARVEHMLTVVQQQQHVPIGHIPPHHISRGVPHRAANTEHTRRLSRNVFGRANRGKIDQPNTVGPLPQLTATKLDGRSGLAHAGRPGQRHQAGSAEYVAEDLELRCTAHQPRERRGYRRNRPVRPIVLARLLQPTHH